MMEKKLKLGHSVITVGEDLPGASEPLGRTISFPPPLTLHLQIRLDSLISAEHEKMSYSSPSRRRQLVLYTFYRDFSLFTGRANIGHSGRQARDVGEQGSKLGNKEEKEKKRLKHKVARFGYIHPNQVCQFTQNANFFKQEPAFFAVCCVDLAF